MEAHSASPDPVASIRPVVDRSAWLEAHRRHLVEEKAFTQQREALAAARRDLPWLEITDPYVFDTESGEVDLLGLFDGRNQLIVYHFMFGPDWGDAGCSICSFWADNYDGTQIHLAERDTSFAVVSRATVPQIGAYRARMGWQFRWVSSGRSTFNEDFGMSATEEQVATGALVYNVETATPMGPESAGVSVFARREDRVFLTFQVAARGLDLLNGTYHLLDLTPNGRGEAALPWPMAWLRRHDEY